MVAIGHRENSRDGLQSFPVRIGAGYARLVFDGDEIEQGFLTRGGRPGPEQFFDQPQIGAAPPEIGVGRRIRRTVEPCLFDEFAVFFCRFLDVHGMAEQ